MSSEAQAGVVIPDPGFRHTPDQSPFRCECVISRGDLEILLRGAESEREIGYRNLSAGIAVNNVAWTDVRIQGNHVVGNPKGIYIATAGNVVLRNTTVGGVISFVDWSPRPAFPNTSAQRGWHGAVGRR